MSKIIPKSVQTCLGRFFRKHFVAHCSMEGPVFEIFQKKSKKFQNSQKCPKMFPKVSKLVLNMLWVNFFRKIFMAQCSMGSRVFEKVQKNQKKSKFQRCPKTFLKVSKRVLNMFCDFFKKIFLLIVPWRVESTVSLN